MKLRRLLAPLAAAVLLAGGAPHAATAGAQEDPNYVWRTDPVSKILAGKPAADRVLHRVPGSLHDAAPVAPEAWAAQSQRGKALYGPGTPVYINGSAMCTVAVAGYDAAGRMVDLCVGEMCTDAGREKAAALSLPSHVLGSVSEARSA